MIQDFRSEPGWYSASLLFKACIADVPAGLEPLWEESIRLICARNEKDALDKANSLGKNLEFSYLTGDGKHLTWKFFRVERIFKIEEGKVGDGVEIFSRYLRDSEVTSLLTPFEA